MARVSVATVAMLCFLSAQTLWAQSSNASLTGFVQDASDALIPGARVTALNTQTGVSATTLTNEQGAYNFASLLPGTYKLSAELAGFRPHVYDEVQLGAGVTARYEFVLEVGQLNSDVDVTANRSAAIAETSATIGQVLTREN